MLDGEWKMEESDERRNWIAVIHGPEGRRILVRLDKDRLTWHGQEPKQPDGQMHGFSGIDLDVHGQEP